MRLSTDGWRFKSPGTRSESFEEQGHTNATKQGHTEATYEQGRSPQATMSEGARCEENRDEGRFTTNDLPGCPKGGLLLGTDKGDWLAGDKGDDEVRGLGGSDDVMGGDGNDVLYGGSQSDGVGGYDGD